MSGFDKELISKAKNDIPIIFHGGFGKLTDLEFLSNTRHSGVAIASSFHYKYLSSIKPR